MICAPSGVQRIPEQNSRCLTNVLHAASVTPDPIGIPFSTYRARLSNFILLYLQLSMIATLPMNDKRKRVVHGVDDDFFDQQSNYLLACLYGGARTIPCFRQVLTESH
jgi:hypothetical protein